MTWLVVLCCVLAALTLLLLLPVGGTVEYGAEGVRAWARVGPARVTVYPFPRRTGKKGKRPKKKKREARAEKPREEQTRGGSPALLLALLEPAREAMGYLRRRLRVDTLYVDYIAASSDPASAAIQFGGAAAMLGVLLGALENLLVIGDRRIRTGISCELDKPEIYVKAGLSIRVGYALALCLLTLFRVYPIYRRQKAAGKEAAARKAATAESAGEPALPDSPGKGKKAPRCGAG